MTGTCVGLALRAISMVARQLQAFKKEQREKEEAAAKK